MCVLFTDASVDAAANENWSSNNKKLEAAYTFFSTRLPML